MANQFGGGGASEAYTALRRRAGATGTAPPVPFADKYADGSTTMTGGAPSLPRLVPPAAPVANVERYGTGDPVLYPGASSGPRTLPPPDNGVEYGKPVRRSAGMTAPSPRVVDATSGVPRVVPSAVDRDAEGMPTMLAGAPSGPVSRAAPSPNYPGIEGRTSALPPLPELTRIMAPNNAEYTREMTESGLRNVAARTTIPGKIGAGVAGAVGIGAGAVADLVKAPYNAIKPVVNGAGEFARGLFGMDPYAPGEDKVAASVAPGVAKPAAPAAAPAVVKPVEQTALPMRASHSPMSGDISGRIPSSVPAPRPADADLRDAARAYAAHLRDANDRANAVNYVYGGPSDYAQPAGQAPAPVVDSNPFRKFDMSNPWNQMFASQWDAASKKNAQAHSVAVANAGANIENASTSRQRANNEPVLKGMEINSAQKLADKQGATSRDVADIGLKGTIYTADAHERAAQRTAEARAAQAKGSEKVPTTLVTPDGMIVRSGINGTEVLDPVQLKAQTKVYDAVRKLPAGANITTADGTVIGKRVDHNGRIYIQHVDGQLEEVPDKIRGGVSGLPTMDGAY